MLPEPNLLMTNGLFFATRPIKSHKKSKKACVFFEVEILDARTRQKLSFLDKVSMCLSFNSLQTKMHVNTLVKRVNPICFASIRYFNWEI